MIRPRPAGELLRLVAVAKTYPPPGPRAPGAREAGPPAQALRDVCLSVARGEFLAVVGPSGAGKSTLLDLLAARRPPDAGHILLHGEDLVGREPEELAWIRNRVIGHVPQADDLIGGLSARENVMAPMRVAGDCEWEAAPRADRLLARVGLRGRESRPAAGLSATERRRVLLARALANAPELLVADEPTADLDAAGAAEVLRVVQEERAARGMAFVAATRDAAVIAACDRVVALADGRVVSVRRQEERRDASPARGGQDRPSP